MGFLTGAAGSLGGLGLGAAAVEIFADIRPLKEGLAAAKGEVASSTASMTASTKAIGTGFIIAGAAAVLAMGKAVSSTEDLAFATKSLQRVTGQTAESASSLLFVAKFLKVDTEALTRGFGLLAKNIDLNAPVLAKFGLELKNADGTTKDFNTILGIAADKYVALGGGLTGAAFAQELFGRGGKALIPILAQGSQGIADLEAEAQKYGIVLSQGSVDAVIELSHAHKELSAAMQGFAITIGTNVVPVLTTLVGGLTKVVLIFDKIPGPVLDIGLGLVALTGFLFLVQKAIAFVTVAWGPLIAAMSGAGVAAEVTGVQYVQLSLELEASAVAAGVETAAVSGMAAAMSLAVPIVGLLAAALVLLAVGTHAVSDAMSPLVSQVSLVAQAAKLAAHDHITLSEAFARVKAQADLAAQSGDAYTQILEQEAAAAKKAKTAQDALAGGLLSAVAAQDQLNADTKELNRLRAQGKSGGVQEHNQLLTVLQDRLSLNASIKDYFANIKKSGETTHQVLQTMSDDMNLPINKLKEIVAGADAVHKRFQVLAGGVTIPVNVNVIGNRSLIGALAP